jgi:LuxR family maltose regulon positive regulatory protein
VQTPLLTTKLHIPSVRSELVPRPRLIERLNAGCQRKLTLISAPAGFGKTMLIADWLSQAGESTTEPVHHSSFIIHHSNAAWLSLDDDDNDPVRFFTYLMAALKTVQADVGTDALALLQAPQPPPLKTAVTMLINSLTGMPGHLVLVLDDFHVIEHQPIHDALTFLLDHLPPQMHLVIAGRSDPPLSLARLRTDNQLTELRAADLRFTFAETVMFLNQGMGLGLSSEEIAMLDARTEGWVAGLQLAALSMRGRIAGQATDFIAAFSGSHRHVIDYLAEEVMDQQPDAIHDFLCQTSLLDRLTAPLCNALTGRDDSSAILRQLEQANLFLIPLDDQRQWYRYHRLFADFLRSHLQQDMPDQVPALHRRASAWYEQQGLPAAAIDHALAGGDFERAAGLIEEAADAILMRSELATLHDWLEALPDKVVRTRPLLCVYQALALVLGGSPLERATSLLQDAVDAGRAGSASGGVVAFRAWVAALQGDKRQTVELSQQALELLPEKRLFLRSLVAASVGLVYTWYGDVGPAFEAFSEVARIGQQSGNVMLTVIALRRLAELRLIQGELNQARTFYEQALASARDGQGRPRPIAGLALMGLGWILLERNDLEGATRRLLEGIELTNMWSEVAGLQGYIGLAYVKQAQGDIDGADEAIRMARQIAVKFDATDMDDVLVGAYQARLWVTQSNADPGRLKAALDWAVERGLIESNAAGLDRKTAWHKLKQAAASASLSFLRVLEYIQLARLYVARNWFDDALAVLELLLPVAERAGWLWFSLEILTLQAVAHQHQGETTEALNVLNQALALAEPEGFVHVFINNGPPMSELLRQAAARGIAVDYVRELLAAYYAGQPGSGRREGAGEKESTPALVDPLSERELEVLRLIAAGLSNREIAAELVVAISTVKTHINNIYRKLDVSSRTQAVARALNMDAFRIK